MGQKVEKDILKLQGKIVQNLGHDLFLIEDDRGRQFKCKPSGRLRNFKISLLVGDGVLFELSLYDLTHGRITRRL